ncbi:MAG: 16S rRNA (guanine(966)-N(2))-methyltransferase, partial [uncultured Blastococcus sp.]
DPADLGDRRGPPAEGAPGRCAPDRGQGAGGAVQRPHAPHRSARRRRARPLRGNRRPRARGALAGCRHRRVRRVGARGAPRPQGEPGRRRAARWAGGQGVGPHRGGGRAVRSVRRRPRRSALRHAGRRGAHRAAVAGERRLAGAGGRRRGRAQQPRGPVGVADTADRVARPALWGGPAPVRSLLV